MRTKNIPRNQPSRVEDTAGPALPRRAEWLFFLEHYAAAGGAPSLATDQVSSNPLGIHDWAQRLEAAVGVVLRSGHKVTPFRNGVEIFPRMLRAIASASVSIEFLFFIYQDGEVAHEICDALIDRAESGIRVKVLLDGFGSKPMPKSIRQKFNESAVDLQVFHPLPQWKFWATDARTHRKILVVDGKLGFTGGVGISHEWSGDAEGPNQFRDTQVSVRGPAVASLRAAFFGNWAAAGGRLPENLDVPGHSVPFEGGTWAGVLAATGATQWSEIALLFQLLTLHARRTLDIVTPYFVPGPALAADLANAAKRGVDVRIMTSGRNTDQRMSRWAGQRYYSNLLSAGARIFEYDRTLQHVKAVVVDQRMVCIGSPNMNQRSTSQDDEIALLTFDRSLANELRADFKADLSDSRSIDGKKWASRGFIRRARELAASVLEAQL